MEWGIWAQVSTNAQKPVSSYTWCVAAHTFDYVTCVTYLATSLLAPLIVFLEWQLTPLIVPLV